MLKETSASIIEGQAKCPMELKEVIEVTLLKPLKRLDMKTLNALGHINKELRAVTTKTKENTEVHSI